MRHTRRLRLARAWQRIEAPKSAPCGEMSSPALATDVVAWHAKHVSSVWQLLHAVMLRCAAAAWDCGAPGGPENPSG